MLVMKNPDEKEGEEAAVDNDTSATEVPEDALLPYAEVREKLASVDFNLDAAKHDDVREKIRWGWRKQPADVENDERYLETTVMSPHALQEVMRGIHCGTKFQVLFSFENLLPRALESLHSQATSKSLFLNRFDITAGDFGFLQDIARYKADRNLLKNFSQGAWVGDFEDPSIIFTPDDVEVPQEMMGKSPNEWCTKTEDKKGLYGAGIFLKPEIELLRPTDWLELSLRSIDNGLRVLYPDKSIDEMDPPTYRKFRREVIRDDRRIDAYFPDTNTVTMFPHWRSGSIGSNSPALGLKWKIENGKARIAVISCEPDKELTDAGPRRSFGRRRRLPTSMLY